MKSIEKLHEAKTYLVQATDGRGEKVTRLVFHVGGEVFVLKELVGGEPVLTPASDWLKRGVESLVGEAPLPRAGKRQKAQAA